MYLALVEESYPAEVAASLGAAKLTIQRIVRDLEDLGLVASRLRGRVRLVSLDPTWYAASELRALLKRMSAPQPGTHPVAILHRRAGSAKATTTPIRAMMPATMSATASGNADTEPARSARADAI